jgi:hypothetical protein
MGQLAVVAVVAVAVAAVFILTKPKGPQTAAPHLGDLKVTDSAYGKAIPILRGMGRVGGNIIQASEMREIAHKEKIKGGKGGGGGGTTTTYTAEVDFLLMIGEGPIEKILRIWADGKIIYDATSLDSIVKKAGLVFRFYAGTEDQLPDPLVEDLVGVDLAPAYRGLCYIVFDKFQLKDFGNRIPQMTVEYAESASPVNYFRPLTGETFTPSSNTEMAINTKTRKGYLIHRILPFAGTLRDTMLVEFDIDSMKVTRSRPFEDVIHPGMNISPTEIDGAPSYMSIGQADGRLYFYVKNSASNAGPSYAIVDPVTMQQGGVNAPVWSIASSYDFLSATRWRLADVAPADGALEFSVDRSTMLQVETFTALGEPAIFNIFLGVYPSFCVTRQLSDYAYQIAELSSGVMGFGTAEPFDHIGISSDIWATLLATPGAVYSNSAEVWMVVGGDRSQAFPEGDPFPEKDIHIGKLTLSPDAPLPATFPFVDFFTTYWSLAFTDVDPLAVCWGALRNVVYVPADNTIVLFLTTYRAFATPVAGPDLSTVKYWAVKWSPSGVIWAKESPQFSIAAGTTNNGNHSSVQQNPHALTDTYSFLSAPTTIVTLNMISGAVSLYDFPEAGTMASGSNAVQWYDAEQDAIIGRTNTNNVVKFYLNRSAGDGVSVASIVSQLCRRANLSDADFDVSAITGDDYMVRGFQATKTSTCRANIEPLEMAFTFYSVESDYVLKFLPKGSDSLVTIPEEMLIPNTQTGQQLDERRIQETELPCHVGITFMDETRDYNTNTAIFQRPYRPTPAMLSSNRVEVELPIVSDFQKMKRLAQKQLYSLWQERSTYSQRVPWNYMWLDPGDELTVELDDGTTLLQRIEKATLGADLQFEMTCVSSDAATYVSTVEGEGGNGVIRMTFPQALTSRLFILDMPLLLDTHNPAAGLSMDYYFMAGYGPTGWRGAILCKSQDNITWAELTDTVNEASYGTLSTVLPDNLDPFSTDYTTTMRVYMTTGADQIQSVTYEQMMAGANAAAVVRYDGTVEVVQWQNATVQSDGSFILDTLLRGRRGTDVYCGGHNDVELFIVLDPVDAIAQAISFSEVGTPKYFRAVTIGTQFEDAATTTITSQGTDLKPYMPRQFTATANAGDIDFTWVRRTRLGGELGDLTGDVPLSEATEAYELEIFDAPGGTLVRTFTGMTTPAKTYLAADIATDFGTMPTEITFKIYQMSALVGRGLSRELTVEVL